MTDAAAALAFIVGYPLGVLVAGFIVAWFSRHL